MVVLLLIFFDADFLLLFMFVADVSKLFLLMQGLVKIFSKLTASLGNNNIENECGGKDYMSMVPLLLLMFDAVVFLLILFAADIQE